MHFLMMAMAGERSDRTPEKKLGFYNSAFLPRFIKETRFLHK
ncbi:hypothetical protein SPLC1_S201740 [Arthrospira platensis C1]|nr:hypothetical protein SPLC1_S201630 [Arthrospira platensis C1]EKD08773.1 hypothetical protein SPLC1_S201740 [Arthrospira platensis C1]